MRIQDLVEIAGLIAFATSGALVAVRNGYDIVGVVALSVVTAIGGGMLRDISLGDLPPDALTEYGFVLLPAVTGLVVMRFHVWIAYKLHRPVLVFDAMGLGLFCVTGAAKAAQYDVTVVGAIVLGVLTATGGGVMRDLLSGERPVMFRSDSVLYSIPAALGSAAVVAVVRLDGDLNVAGPIIAAVVAAIRLAALRFGWRAPRPPGVDTS